MLAGVGLVVVNKLPSDHSYWVVTNTRLLGLQIKIGRPLRSSLMVQFSSDNIFDINLLLTTR